MPALAPALALVLLPAATALGSAALPRIDRSCAASTTMTLATGRRGALIGGAALAAAARAALARAAAADADPSFSRAPSGLLYNCLLYTSPSPRDGLLSRMPSSA